MTARTDGRVTCPRCLLSFSATDDGSEPAAVEHPGTMTVLPDAPASPPVTPSALPSRIGRFEIRRFLGEGSFGRVYEAYDPTLKRVVALKVAKAEQMGGPKRVARFQREARAAANLMHPNIVAVFDSGEDAGQHYIACAFVPGRSLAETLDAARGQDEQPTPTNPDAAALPPSPAVLGGRGVGGEGGKTLPIRDTVEVVRKLAEALAYAHKQGVVHRDVKPGNVMLRDDGEPLLMDFGLAARHDETEKLTVAGQFMGTPEYSAPEQWRGEASAASDQYSLGVLLFELLTGEKPFSGASSEHYLMLHTTQAAPSPRQYRADLPRDLENITLKCLEKEVGRRYADCQSLADDLRRWCDGEPVTARRPGVGERLLRWGRKKPAVATLSAAVLLVFAAGATVATVFGMAANESAKQATIQAKRADDEAGKAKKEAKAARDAEQKADREAKAAKTARDRAEDNEKQAKKAREEADEKKAAAEMGRHGFMMTAALHAWRGHDVAAAEAILKEVPANFQKTWEYGHVRGLCDRKALTLRGHKSNVTSVAFSSDGTRIASASDDKTVKVWDTRTGQELLSITGHTDKVTRVAFSPDRSRLASASEDKTVRVWDARTGKEILVFKGHMSKVNCVVFSPDGSRLASASEDKTVQVWDARTGRVRLTIKGIGHVKTLAYSPDGTDLVLPGLQMLGKILNANTGEERASLGVYLGNSVDLSWSVAYSPDGSCVATGGFDGKLRISDASTGQERVTMLGHTSTLPGSLTLVTSVAFSPDGTQIASSSWDNAVRVWDVKTGQQLYSLRGHDYYVQSVAFSPDGSRIASGSMDNTVKLWDLDVLPTTHQFKGHNDLVRCMALNHDGSRLASGGTDKKLKVWDVRTNRELLSINAHSDYVNGLAFSPDGTRIASASDDKTVKVRDAKSGREVLSFKRHSDQVRFVIFSPDSSQVASGGRDKTIAVWDAKTGKQVLTFKGHKSSTLCAAYSPDGSRIASGGWDDLVKVWDARSGQEYLTLKGHRHNVNAVAYSPDGSLIVSASDDKTVRVWDAKTGKPLHLLKGHVTAVQCVAFSPDGTRIVAGSADRWVKIWDVKTGQELISFEAHQSQVSSVVFSPDGSRIITAGDDIKFWDAATGQPDSPAELVRRARAFHRTQIDSPVIRQNLFAWIFHFDRLMALTPADRGELILQRRNMLRTALKKDPKDHWAARTLARQVIADHEWIYNKAELIDLLSRHQHAPQDLLYGALLLRNGETRDAAIVLRAALRHRQPDTAPIEELLLSIACSKLKRRDEARNYLGTAIAWMECADQSIRATSLVGLSAANPFVALGTLTHTPPDPRLNPLDPFTDHEIRKLRKEAEAALAEED